MKKKKRLIWQLYPSYLLITLISLVAVTWYASEALRVFSLDQATADLRVRSKLVEKQLLPYLQPLSPKAVDEICKDIGRKSEIRITIVSPSGTVIGDSLKSAVVGNNVGQYHEVKAAMSGHQDQSIRSDPVTEQRMMYLAKPIQPADRLLAVIQTSIPITPIDDAISAIQFQIALGGLFIAVLAAGVSLFISRRISGPIVRMKEGAARFSNGDLTFRLPSPETEEIASLTDAMNQMAAQLDDRIKIVIHQRNELEAVLTSMVEGVVAVDKNERIINMNRAAGRMFEADPKRVQGRNIQEVIRNLSLQRFISQALSSQESMEEDIVLYSRSEMVLHLQSSPLNDAKLEQIGTLLVLNDVTQLRHLEDVRRDFVANVSHEIKTPLTAIKGYVETLHQGAVDDAEERKRFLGIILKHVDRLNAIVEDLLALSRIESENDRSEIQLKKESINDVIQTAIQVCQSKAAAKDIAIDLQCNAQIEAKIDSTLLEQALVNLIDNATKYSDNSSSIEIDIVSQNGTLAINIKDHGHGVPKKHLPRLFERFYRVDKARSRILGGTGLGLAIVKHIVQAHGGRVLVESVLGKGSTFTVQLPTD